MDALRQKNASARHVFWYLQKMWTERVRMREGLPQLIAESSAVICLGGGGVGKTTTAAAIALRAALGGRRVACVTVDPARRLAQCFGFEAFTGEAQPVDLAAVRARERSLVMPEPGGALDVLMLDSKAMFDALIERHALSQERVQRIFDNPIYQQVSTSLAGTREYMALEKLHELRTSGKYDLVVVDTPPAANAEDLLSAPSRLAGLVESPLMQWLGRAFSEEGTQKGGPVAAGARTILAGFAKIVSDSFLQEVAIFVGAMRSLLGGFVARANETIAVLHDEQVAKILVARPEDEVIDGAETFAKWLTEQSLEPHAVVVNRVEAAPPALRTQQDIAVELREAFVDDGQMYATEVWMELADIALEERARVQVAYENQKEPLARLKQIAPLVTIPVLVSEGPLERLAAFANALWAHDKASYTDTQDGNPTQHES